MSHSTPTVSVIIPIYNVQDYLDQCLQSVLQQTYKHLEILCVIDGSQDDSEKIARRYAQSDDRCRTLTQTNQGLSVARNTGLQAATGEWIFFLDSDDWLAENAIQNLVEAARKSGRPVISGAVMEHWEGTGTQKPYQRPGKRPTGLLDLHGRRFFSLEPMVWNKLYRRDLAVTCPFTPGLVHEDLDFYWRFFSRYSQVYAIPDTVIHYRCRSGTLSRQKFYDDTYQDNYIRIVDNAFLVAENQRQLRYEVYRQSLKYLKYLRQRQAPSARYQRHIQQRYRIKDTKAFRFWLQLRRLVGAL